MQSVVYAAFREALGKGQINLASDPVKAMLVRSAYAPDEADHRTRADVSHEVTGPGYAKGGLPLAGQTWRTLPDGKTQVFDADDLKWPEVVILGARGVVVYHDTGDADTDTLICCLDLGDEYTVAPGTFTLPWREEGILRQR